MGLASGQRHTFSDALLEVGPDAPTLCAGWTAYDLAAHCWVRERSLPALVGIGVPGLGKLAEDAMARAKASHPFPDLARRLAATPPTPVTIVPGGDDAVNLAEYLIHTEDVRRANGLPLRPIEPRVEEALWRRLPLVGRALFAGSPVGVALERTDASAPPLRVKAGDTIVTLSGRPSELLLFAFGREAHADVRPIGEPDAVQRLLATKRGA